MKKIVLLSLAITAGAMITATSAVSYQKSARTLPSSQNVEKVSDISKYYAPLKVENVRANSLNTKVIATKKLKGGAAIEYVKGSNGEVHKRLTIENHNKQILNNRGNGVSLKANAVVPSFFEGFEGWDGTTYDWIPADWQDVSKVGTVAPGKDTKLMNLTWTASDGFMEKVIEGKYDARCQVSFPDQEAGVAQVPQDEWLITPSITPKANENLYFYLNYRPGWTLIDVNTMTFTAQNNILEVQISEDNGTTWTKMWDCLADAKSFTEEELWDDVTSMSRDWLFVPIDLKAYENKSIKIAFRYVGEAGESVIVDAIRISTATAQASYIRPDGYFYKGFSTTYASSSVNSMLGAAFTNATWLNNSNLESESYVWSYTDPTFASQTPIQATTTSLDVNYPYAQVDVPSLTASAIGSADATYQWGINKKGNPGYVQTGGNNNVTFQEQTEETVLGTGNYDLSKGFTFIQVGKLGQYAFGTGSDEWWSDAKSKWEVKAIANYFEKPAHSYFLTTMWVQGWVTADADAEFTLTIKKINANGSIGDVIATSTCVGSEIISTDVGDTSPYCSIPFTFKVKDPVSGLEEPSIINIEDAILVEFSGFKSPKVKVFGPFQQATANTDEECNSYVYFDVTKDVEGVPTTKTILYKTSDLLTSRPYSAFLFNMDATYTWFETEGDAFEAPITGGEKTFDVNTYFSTSAWTVEEEDAGTLPAWLTVTKADGATNRDPAKLTFTVEALPAGVTGRATNVTMSIPGSKKTFRITQGDSGVEGVKTSAIKVASVGGDFEVSYPTSVSSVNIYNVSGQLVNRVELNDGGNAIIPAQNLAKGMYILKFNDNSTVKAIK